MKTKEKLENLLGLFWVLAGSSAILFMFVLFVLIFILRNGDVPTWPLWAKVVLLLPISIAGLSAFFSIIILIIQMIRGDDEGYD